MARDDTPSPKPLLDKLGVKPEHRVAVLALDDEGFLAQLRERAREVHVDRRRVGLDMIFLGVAEPADLRRIRTQKDFIDPAGAVWVVWPKGRPEVTENAVRAAALEAGLVDVKVVSFSERLSALKLVIRVADRPRP